MSIYGVLVVFEWLVFVYFLYATSYSIIFSVAALFYKDPIHFYAKRKKILVLIPAFREDGVIKSVAASAVNHNYPSDKFDVLVIADSLKNETVKFLKAIPSLKVLEVDFVESTKVKALSEAVNSTNVEYEIVVILDADNLMEDSFLYHINGALSKDILAIQGQRVAKNKETKVSYLDAISEAINNKIYRQGSSALGLSCSFIGSAMALEFKLFKELINQMDAIGGFDRDMEVRLLERGTKVQYLKRAIVYDEKVSSVEVFRNQRKRWIYSQYHYLWSQLKPGFKKLFQGNLTYFNSAVLRNIQLPRLINIGLLLILTLVSFFFPLIGFPYWVWLILFGLIVFSNVIAIPRSYINKEFFLALLSLPKIFVVMFLLLFKLKGANKKFIHTPHSS